MLKIAGSPRAALPHSEPPAVALPGSVDPTVPPTVPPTELQSELLSLAIAIAADAATILVEGLDRARTTVDTKTTGTDMVTEMDRAAERLIVDAILAARPSDAILGEEGTDRPGTTGVRWIVDPIDGTTNYLYAHAGFAVSIAAEVDGNIEIGVVHDPLHQEVFTAVRGGGAQRNGIPISASSETRLGHALIATGFSYEPDRRRRQAAVLIEILPLVRDIRRMGAASVDLCSVACGRVDAYYERGLQPWDHAAGALIAREAGALVSSLKGEEPDFEFCLAAPAALAAQLRPLLREHGAGSA
ncbi:MAG: inositol monophosphatase [Actinobacteria bacterium]|nr:inositol monophosphatase [Actinomycetota bacterium]